jgi:FMN-dependent NADH-azoreductase
VVNNFGFDYVSALAKSFYGINDVRFVSAEGLDIRGADAGAILLAAKKSVKDILDN